MNRTMVVGTILLAVGVLTHTKFSGPISYDGVGATFGVLGITLGTFILWNGWVAKYNMQPTFALLG